MKQHKYWYLGLHDTTLKVFKVTFSSIWNLWFFLSCFLPSLSNYLFVLTKSKAYTHFPRSSTISSGMCCFSFWFGRSISFPWELPNWFSRGRARQVCTSLWSMFTRNLLELLLGRPQLPWGSAQACRLPSPPLFPRARPLVLGVRLLFFH